MKEGGENEEMVGAQGQITMKLDFLVIKNKGNFDPFNSMKAYTDSGGIAPTILNLGARQR